MAVVGDTWALEIGDCYLSVLTRPTYGAVIIEKLIYLPYQYDCHYRAIIEVDENRYQFVVNFNKRAVTVYVHPLNQDGELDGEQKFHYQKGFLRSKPDKVRKAALILAKKLKMRTVMDIMKM